MSTCMLSMYTCEKARCDGSAGKWRQVTSKTAWTAWPNWFCQVQACEWLFLKTDWAMLRSPAGPLLHIYTCTHTSVSKFTSLIPRNWRTGLSVMPLQFYSESRVRFLNLRTLLFSLWSWPLPFQAFHEWGSVRWEGNMQSILMSSSFMWPWTWYWL